MSSDGQSENFMNYVSLMKRFHGLDLCAEIDAFWLIDLVGKVQNVPPPFWRGVCL